MEQLHFEPYFIGFFGHVFLCSRLARVLKKTHFHPRGVAKMEKLQFEAPAGGPFRRSFLGVFCVRDPEG